MRIVLIEQDRNNLAMLETNLIRWGFGVSTTQDPEDALDLIEGDPGADMVICDWATISGYNEILFKAIHEIRKSHYVYIIIVDLEKYDYPLNLLEKPFKM